MIVKLLLPLVLAFIMFSLGLGLRGRDFSRVLKFPVAFGAGLLDAHEPTPGFEPDW